MRFESQVFWTSKDSAYPEEYQDAFSLDPERGIAAIADGVSSAIFSGPWARILTEAAVAEPPPFSDLPQFREWLQRQRLSWKEQIDTSRLTWFQKPKMADGAMSTLLWIELTPVGEDANGQATAFRLVSHAIGDCCLFQVRDREVLQAFPLTTAAEFGLNPEVLGSSNSRQDDEIEFRSIEVDCQSGDLIVLCTDAIALWAFMRYEAGESVNWDDYWQMPQEQWLDELKAHREANAMRYDDSTVVLLRPGSPASVAVPSDVSDQEPNEIASGLDCSQTDAIVVGSSCDQSLPVPAEPNERESSALLEPELDSQDKCHTSAEPELPLGSDTEANSAGPKSKWLGLAFQLFSFCRKPDRTHLA